MLNTQQPPAYQNHYRNLLPKPYGGSVKIKSILPSGMRLQTRDGIFIEYLIEEAGHEPNSIIDDLEEK